MKVISVWQPWASLIVHNHKFTETRSWPAPRSIVGQRIGIASTKIIRREQRLAARDPEFQWHYDRTSLPSLDEVPLGCLLGSALLASCDVMTEEQILDLTDQEKVFGVWEPGRFAWRLREPKTLPVPVPVVGRQGIWEYGDLS